MRRLLLSILSLLALLGHNAWAQTAALYGTNGSVLTTLRNGNTIYLGGEFTVLGKNLPYGIATAASTGAINTAYPKPNGIVHAVVPDGLGGWYVGGDFTSIGGVVRNRLAQINGSGQVTSWNPSVNGSVRSLAVSGTTVYAGGQFNLVNTNGSTQTRNRLAAFDATVATNNVTIWDPSVSGSVYALAVSGTTVYAGGTFALVNANGTSKTRNNLAAFDATVAVNNATSWDPGVSGSVYALALSGTTVYAGGEFSSVNTNSMSQTRNSLAAFDATLATNNAMGWDPSVSGSVNALAISGTTVYAGGAFTSVNTNGTSQTRNRLAAFSTTTATNNVTSWDPSLDGEVQALVLSGTTLYAGGAFGSANTSSTPQVRNGGAAFSTTTAINNTTAWNPSVYDRVNALAVSGATVYAGGSFTIAEAISRKYLAALDAATGAPTAWDPSLNGAVQTLAVSGTTVYAGGAFTSVNTNGTSKTRNRLAAFSTTASTNNVTTWDPAVNGTVYALALSGSIVYAGGIFNSVNSNGTSKIRNNLAAFDATVAVNNATSWDPSLNGTVQALALSGTTLYAGGAFTAVNTNSMSQTRNRLAAFDATIATDNATPWDPSVSGSVNALAISGTTVYAGGAFTSANTNGTSQTRNRLAAFSTTTATNNVTAWNPSVNSVVRSLAVSGTTVYVGGKFNSVNTGGTSKTRNSLAAFDAAVATNNATAWNPRLSGITVFALSVSGTTVYAGGLFSTVGTAATPASNLVGVSENGVPLQLQLLGFTGRAEGQANRLSWRVTGEEPGTVYIVERSANGDGFEPIGSVAGTATADYVYTDASSASGTVYYRLRIAAGGGTASCSPVVVIRRSGVAAGSITLAPQPAASSLVLTCTDASLAGTRATVLDMQGREVAQFFLAPFTTLNVSGWAPGLYTLYLVSGEVLRLVKR